MRRRPAAAPPAVGAAKAKAAAKAQAAPVVAAALPNPAQPGLVAAPAPPALALPDPAAMAAQPNADALAAHTAALQAHTAALTAWTSAATALTAALQSRVAAAPPTEQLQRLLDALGAHGAPPAAAGSASSSGPREPEPACPAGLLRLRTALEEALRTDPHPTAGSVLQRAHMSGTAAWAQLRALLAVYHSGDCARVLGAEMDERRSTAELAETWKSRGPGQLPSIVASTRKEPATILNHVARRMRTDAQLRQGWGADLLRQVAEL